MSVLAHRAPDSHSILTSIVEAVASIGHAFAAGVELSHLLEMSDKQLAARGFSRETVVQDVFRAHELA